MKTNNVMVRPMGDFVVQQRTKDGMFNATSLLKQWNTSPILNTQNSGELKKKDLDDFFINKGVKEFIEALIAEENLNSKNSCYLTSRGKTGGTWMHPYLFVKFAMWLNPRFEVKVIKFVYDQMIQYRNEAGDAYKYLSAAVSKLVEKPFMAGAMTQISKGVNFCVFGDHRKMIRNERGDEAAQRALFEFERKLGDLINEGFLRTFQAVMNYLRETWRRKFQVN